MIKLKKDVNDNWIVTRNGRKMSYSRLAYAILAIYALHGRTIRQEGDTKEVKND